MTFITAPPETRRPKEYEMSRSYARNGTSKRLCTHCYLCHGEKHLNLPRHRDLKHQLDVIDIEVERYFTERRLHDFAGQRHHAPGGDRETGRFPT